MKEIFTATGEGDFKLKSPNGDEILFKSGFYKYADEIEELEKIHRAYTAMGLEFDNLLMKAQKE